MQKLTVKRREVDFKRLRLRDALTTDCSVFIEGSAAVYEGGELKIVYQEFDERMPWLVDALKKVDYKSSFRASGLPTISRVFGYKPRSTLRNDFCASTSLAHESPGEHATICRGAALVERLYQEANHELHQEHRALTEKKVHADWRLEGTVFTSGIANKDNQLKYHFDTGNFKNVWSAMLTFKKDIEGGHLAVPEYDLCFKLRDHSALMFDGQGLLHGVTPFTKFNDQAYRYTVVYYSLRQMWNCLSPTEELTRIRRLKTEREWRRAGLK